ncbi:DUF5320 domain-containing protein [Flexithrix dorotheae]|uniref:DUF5320 domain-containing protein n=1 Tax=Flexithrix dorotheae TaxID=70993 RepID=UPI00035D06F9|nr:DUF5320 domain-containing protein [Flexithrix dorotheae]|eukprot:TRINITY_DN27377_c0_g1_i2.p2 TRINITY_DN27377_c0_g1~~TRINITY_DN27377_c0_g1_i2.p2  ORF type:complete len:132 (-),score=15.03 TRINITY_DN27377_c0_g1_i2:84-425(-)
MKQNDDKLESLINEFIKEMMSRGFNKFRQANNGRNPGMDDLFDMFNKFKQKFEWDNSEEVVPTKEEDKKDDFSKDLEIKYLKEQVETLKEQLKDKDKIIKMLKDKKAKSKVTD